MIFQQCEGGDLNPYANYGASTSSRGGGIQGREEREKALHPAPSFPGSGVANGLANLRQAMIDAYARGDDKQGDELRAELARPLLRVVG